MVNTNKEHDPDVKSELNAIQFVCPELTPVISFLHERESLLPLLLDWISSFRDMQQIFEIHMRYCPDLLRDKE